MRIGFLIFSFVFDLVVQLVSRCLLFALILRVVTLLNSTCVRVLYRCVILTFRVVPLFTSTYVCVLASVCYPGLPATDLAGSIFVTRPKNFDGSVFLLCRFNLPRFRNLAQTCRVFVSSRRFSVPLFRSPQTRCGIFFVGLFVDFCTTYGIGAYLGIVYVSKPAVVCPSWLFSCFLHYVRH